MSEYYLIFNFYAIRAGQLIYRNSKASHGGLLFLLKNITICFLTEAVGGGNIEEIFTIMKM